MPLSDQQVANLLKLIAASEHDQLDCDSCFELVAEFAELHVKGQEVPAAMQSVRIHIEQCPCCADEFNALLEALQGLEEA